MQEIRGKSVLVSGGAGFIGSHLVDQLVSNDPKSLVVVDNFFLGQEMNLLLAKSRRSDLQILRLDASDSAAMSTVAINHKIDVVFDLAVVPLPTSLEYPSWTVMTNIGITTNFCELLRKGEVDELIHLSSSEAYGSARYVPMDEAHPHDAITPYAASKSAGDHIVASYIQTFGVKAVTVRPFNNFGPRQNPGSYAGIIPIVIKNVMTGKPIEIHGDGNQTRDFLFVRETAKGICDIYKNENCLGKTLNLGSGKETSINTLVEMILDALGAHNHPIIHTERRQGDVLRHCADMTQTTSILGKSLPAISNEQISETVDWYRDLFARSN